MDGKCKSVTRFEHLKPLSVYSRTVISGKSCVKKRKLDDSMHNDIYETPAKKVFSPKSFSPDLGCFMDYYSPLDRRDTPSPFAASTPAQDIKNAINESVISQLQCKHVECESSAGAENNNLTVPHSLFCRKVFLNLAPVFDFDAQEILCHKGEVTREKYVDVKEEQAEECLVTSYKSEPKMGQNSPQLGQSLLPTATSSPLQRLCEVKEQQQVKGDDLAPISESLITHGIEEDTDDTGYETTLPLQVQVKSVVVPSQQTTSNKLVTPPLSEQNTKTTKPNPAKDGVVQRDTCVSSARSHSLVLFNEESDLEHEKQRYVHLVTTHMNENQGGNQGIITELLNLMTHVADETTGSDSRQWQHPSDLTCRNYQRCFGNSQAQIALHEWQERNFKSYQRFAKLPRNFKRSFI